MGIGTPIKESSGKILGFVETKPNGDKILRDFYGKILGRYVKGLNATQDFSGRKVAQGDCLMMLLR